MHNAMVNHLRFTPDATHLFSAGSDGALAATRTGSWISEGLWKAPHNGKPINHISIHPSGKLALTLGADLTLKTWNLVKGRQVRMSQVGTVNIYLLVFFINTLFYFYLPFIL